MITIWLVHVLNMCLKMLIIFFEKIGYFMEKYRIHHGFSNLNKSIMQIEQATVLSSEEHGHSFKLNLINIQLKVRLCRN